MTKKKNEQIVSLHESDSKKYPIQFYINDDLRQRLRKYCFDKEEKFAPVLRDILREFLEQKGY